MFKLIKPTAVQHRKKILLCCNDKTAHLKGNKTEYHQFDLHDKMVTNSKLQIKLLSIDYISKYSDIETTKDIDTKQLLQFEMPYLLDLVLAGNNSASNYLTTVIVDIADYKIARLDNSYNYYSFQSRDEFNTLYPHYMPRSEDHYPDWRWNIRISDYAGIQVPTLLSVYDIYLSLSIEDV